MVSRIISEVLPKPKPTLLQSGLTFKSTFAIQVWAAKSLSNDFLASNIMLEWTSKEMSKGMPVIKPCTQILKMISMERIWCCTWDSKGLDFPRVVVVHMVQLFAIIWITGKRKSKVSITMVLGGKYLVFVSSRSVEIRGSSAFSVCIFLRKVCLFFNFWMKKCTIMFCLTQLCILSFKNWKINTHS